MKTRAVLALSLGFATVLVGCTSDLNGSDAGTTDDIFATAPRNATATTLIGLWETATSTQNGTATTVGRIDLRSDHVTSATRCSDGVSTPVTVAVRVSASVTPAAITTNEVAQDTQPIGSGNCAVYLARGTIPACDPSTTESARANCFALTGGQLVFYQSSGPLAMVKVSD